MKHIFTNDFISICRKIISENRTSEEWVLIESDDMFQEGSYTGGFDSTEMEFTFSFFEVENEYWFQIPLGDIFDVVEGKRKEVDAIEAER